MELFYVHPENVFERELVLDDFERKHIVRILRKEINDSIMVTDGAGRIFKGIITGKNPKLVVKIQEQKQKPPKETQIILACGFIKQNRMDFILEKGTELGVDRFWFFRSRYANYFSANTERLHKVIRQALKQSLRVYLPQVEVFASLGELFRAVHSIDTRLIAIDARYPKLTSLFEDKDRNSSRLVIVAVGPEGGFDTAELKQFRDNGFRGFSLGANRLRTETAALASTAIVSQYIH